MIGQKIDPISRDIYMHIWMPMYMSPFIPETFQFYYRFSYLVTVWGLTLEKPVYYHQFGDIEGCNSAATGLLFFLRTTAYNILDA